MFECIVSLKKRHEKVKRGKELEKMLLYTKLDIGMCVMLCDGNQSGGACMESLAIK